MKRVTDTVAGAARNRTAPGLHLGQDESAFPLERVEGFLLAFLVVFLIASANVLPMPVKPGSSNRRNCDRRCDALFGFHAMLT